MAARGGSGASWSEPGGPGGGSVIRRTFTVSLTVLLVVVFAWLVVNLWGIVLMVFAALIMAATLLGPASAVESVGVPRPLAIVLTYLAVLLVMAGVLLIVIPPLVSQAAALAHQVPGIAQTAAQKAADFVRPFGGPKSAKDLENQIVNGFKNNSGLLTSVAQLPLTALAVGTNTVTAVVLSGFMLYERDRARDFALRFVAPRDRAFACEVLHDSVEKLGLFVRGQLIIMTFVGVATAAGLTVLHVPFAVPLGLLAFTAEAIPMVGPFVFGVPMVIDGLTQSLLTGLLTLVLIVVVQEIEAWLLVPLVHRAVVALSPLLSLLVIVIGAALSGIVGAFLAIPFTAMMTVIVDEVVLPWRERAWRIERPDDLST